jgi:hypothetical protein
MAKTTTRRVLEAVRRSSFMLEASETSLNDRMDKVRQAVSQKFNQGPGDYCYCEVIFDAYVVVSKGGKLWRVDYSVGSDGTVMLSNDDPIQVRVSYTPVGEGVIFGLMPDVDGPVQVAEGAEPPAPTGKKWGVLIIQEGMSKNRNRYGRKCLQEAAPLYEGAKIFLDHQEETRRFGRSVKDQAGFLKNVQGAMLGRDSDGKEATSPIFALSAMAVITKPSVRQEMLDAYAEGNADFYGLSHDAFCESVCCSSEDGPFYDVTKIESVQSVDLVSNPAAGGRVLRLVASDTVAHSLERDGHMLKKMIEAIRKSGNAALIAKLDGLGQTPSEDQVIGLYQEALATPAPAAHPTTESVPAVPATPAAAVPAVAATPAAPAATATATTEAVATQEGAVLMEALADGRGLFLANALATCALPEPVKESIRKTMGKRITDAKTVAQLPAKAEITSVIREQVELFGQLAEAGVVQPVIGLPRIQVIKARRDKIQESLDDFFGVKTTEKDGQKVHTIVENSRGGMRSFRQLYVEITGDSQITGKVSESVRLSESLDSTSFDQILGDSITRRMLADYALASQAVWRGTIADVVPVQDFRVQRRMRFGGYGNLPTVNQGAAYTSLTSPTDEEATYTPAKRGGTEQLSIEMIANDDVGAIRKIPMKMARAASQTLYEFVFDFLRTNAAIYDTVALAAAGHGTNIITTALSSSNLSSARLKMKAQTDMSNGKRLGLAPRYLVVPNDLEELAFQLTTSDRVMPDSSIPTTAQAAAPNFVRKMNITPIVVDYWTDTNDWWVASSLDQTPLIEVGFFGGREEPELFVQDTPNIGSLFSNDVITYKIRHVYGGGVMDFRGFVGGIVP